MAHSKIINVMRNDWGNLGQNLTKAMRSVNMDAECYALNAHAFGYEDQAVTVTLDRMRSLVADADIVNFVHSDIFLLETFKPQLRGKKVVVTYTGSAYRNNPDAHNAAFNPVVQLSLTDHCEFISLGAKNIHYITFSVDSGKGIPHFGHQIEAPYKIGHFPSNVEVKGTAQILRMLCDVKRKFGWLCSEEIVSNKDQLKRLDLCDIYIELFKPELNGRPYGHYGVTAFEAAAAGKIVITQNLNWAVYADAYGECALRICNTPASFVDQVEMLLALPPLRISEIQTETYNWVSQKHSFKANGERLKKLILA